MNFKKTSTVLGVVALTTFAVAPAQAQDTGWYVGAGAGRSAVTIDDARISSGLIPQGLGTPTIDNHDRDNGYKVFGGYQLTPNFAVEGGYVDLGHFGYTATIVPAGTLDGDIRLKALDLDLVGTLPLFGHLSALGRVGVTSIRASDNFSATGAVHMPYPSASPSQRSTDYKFGAGLMYDFTPSLAMRLEAERYRLKDAVGNTGHADLFFVSLIYRFGAKPQPMHTAAPQPVVMAAAPVMPAPPAPVAPPPPPARVLAAAPMRITLSADALFDFDKSTIKPAGQLELDKLAADLRGMSYDRVQVTGHTDRLGPHEYNLRLSTRRADAVSAYLVQAGAVPADKITATGVDGENPVTQAGDCKGNKPTPALIACLQPDRRVEVEVTGTK